MKIDPATQKLVNQLLLAQVGAEWHVTIPMQLDRTQYVKLNQVLEEAGGTWKRGKKAHVFAKDPSAVLNRAGAAGEIHTRRDDDFFWTPAPRAAQVVAMAAIEPGEVVLEPSAGAGALIDALPAHTGKVFAIERNVERRTALRARLCPAGKAPKGTVFRVLDLDDFLLAAREDFVPDAIDAVIMNPPFSKVGEGDYIDHVLHAWSLLAPGGRLVAIMPGRAGNVAHRSATKRDTFGAFLDEHVTHSVDLPAEAFAEAGTRVLTYCVRLDKPAARRS